jgi:hypothetical protein
LILASPNMPLASDRQVNEKPFKIGTNSQNPPLFDPLSWEKTASSVTAEAKRSKAVNFMAILLVLLSQKNF